jgi:hypothetical protein
MKLYTFLWIQNKLEGVTNRGPEFRFKNSNWVKQELWNLTFDGSLKHSGLIILNASPFLIRQILLFFQTFYKIFNGKKWENYYPFKAKNKYVGNLTPPPQPPTPQPAPTLVYCANMKFRVVKIFWRGCFKKMFALRCIKK